MTQAANLNPRHGKAGRQPTRAGLKPPSANADPGMFGRMFELPASTAPEAALQALAAAMKDASPDDQAGDNASVPSGFTEEDTLLYEVGHLSRGETVRPLLTMDGVEADPVAFTPLSIAPLTRTSVASTRVVPAVAVTSMP